MDMAILVRVVGKVNSSSVPFLSSWSVFVNSIFDASLKGFCGTTGTPGPPLPPPFLPVDLLMFRCP